MLVDPNSDTIYVITKVAAGMPSAVYKFPATFGGSTLTAEKVVDLTVPKSTDREAVSASAHPCAPAFLLRTYNTLYEFRAPAGVDAGSRVSRRSPPPFPSPPKHKAKASPTAPMAAATSRRRKAPSRPINRVACQ